MTDFSRTLSCLYYQLNHISQPPMSKPKCAVRFKHSSLYYRFSTISPALTCTRPCFSWGGAGVCVESSSRSSFPGLFITSRPAPLLLVLCLGIICLISAHPILPVLLGPETTQYQATLTALFLAILCPGCSCQRFVVPGCYLIQVYLPELPEVDCSIIRRKDMFFTSLVPKEYPPASFRECQITTDCDPRAK